MGFGVYSTLVFAVELVGDVNAARNRTARRELCFHLIRVRHRPPHGVDIQPPVHVAVFGERPPFVPFHGFTRPRKERLGWLAWCTVLADAHRLALSVSRLVRLARLVGDPVSRDVLVNLRRISSLAATTRPAVDEHLRSEYNLWERGVASDFDAIGQRRGGSHGPTAAAVLRDVLIPRLGEVVDAVDVAPKHVRREVVAHIQLLVWTRGDHALAGEERRLRGSAVFVRSSLT